MSSIGASNVELIYRDVSNNGNRTMSAEPCVILSFEMENVGDVYFERISDVGYHYINGELVSKVLYNTTSNQRSIGMPSNITSSYYASPASGFSTFNYWAYEDWLVEFVRDMVTDEIISALTGGIIGSFARFSMYYDIVTKSSVAEAAEYCFTVWDLYCSATSEDFFGATLFYNSQNTSCNILHWYGVRMVTFSNNNYTNSNYWETKSFVKNTNPYWFANPNDFTQPSACRILTQTYPY